MGLLLSDQNDPYQIDKVQKMSNRHLSDYVTLLQKLRIFHFVRAEQKRQIDLRRNHFFPNLLASTRSTEINGRRQTSGAERKLVCTRESRAMQRDLHFINFLITLKCVTLVASSASISLFVLPMEVF